jgi:hypothetical protein
MAIHTLVYRALWIAALVILVAGCANPKSNPIVEPPPIVQGRDLDLNQDNIGPTGDGLPWLVNSDWVIAAGRTVTIQAGTEIAFTGLYWVDVEGQMIAEGAADNPVTFTSGFLEPTRGDWRSFKLRNTSTPSIFRYCVFSYGAHIEGDTLTEVGREAQNYRGTLGIRNSSTVVEHCLFYKGQNNGIYIQHDSTESVFPAPVIRYNVITDNDGAAIRTSDGVDLNLLDVSRNIVGGNSIIPFLLSQADSSFGVPTILNENLDSTDIYYNLDYPPELVDPANGQYTLTSCSPAVDAAPDTSAFDPDGTRGDLGPYPYHQVANELRGVKTGTLNAGETYRMSCHVRVPEGQTLIVPAGTRIEVSGLYNLEVFGRIEFQGEPGNRVSICNCQVPGLDVWGDVIFENIDPDQPSLVRNTDFQNYRSLWVYEPGVQFDNVSFEGGLWYGAVVSTWDIDPADSVSFHNCTFNDCGIYGLGVDSSTVMLRNSCVSNIRGRGVSFYATASVGEVTNTVVEACSTSAIVMEALSSPRIVNCVLTANQYHGLHMIDNCNPTVMNTIIWANHHHGVKAEGSSTPLLQYNNIAGNLDANIDPPSIPCDNCISQDPLFVGNGDFHLMAGSPSIDAGNPDPEYNDGDGSRNDQGAYGGPGGGTACTSGSLLTRGPVSSRQPMPSVRSIKSLRKLRAKQLAVHR